MSNNKLDTAIRILQSNIPNKNIQYYHHAERLLLEVISDERTERFDRNHAILWRALLQLHDKQYKDCENTCNDLSSHTDKLSYFTNHIAILRTALFIETQQFDQATKLMEQLSSINDDDCFSIYLSLSPENIKQLCVFLANNNKIHLLDQCRNSVDVLCHLNQIEYFNIITRRVPAVADTLMQHPTMLRLQATNPASHKRESNTKELSVDLNTASASGMSPAEHKQLSTYNKPYSSMSPKELDQYLKENYHLLDKSKQAKLVKHCADVANRKINKVFTDIANTTRCRCKVVHVQSKSEHKGFMKQVKIDYTETGFSEDYFKTKLDALDPIFSIVSFVTTVNQSLKIVSLLLKIEISNYSKHPIILLDLLFNMIEKYPGLLRQFMRCNTDDYHWSFGEWRGEISDSSSYYFSHFKVPICLGIADSTIPSRSHHYNYRLEHVYTPFLKVYFNHYKVLSSPTNEKISCDMSLHPASKLDEETKDIYLDSLVTIAKNTLLSVSLYHVRYENNSALNLIQLALYDRVKTNSQYCKDLIYNMEYPTGLNWERLHPNYHRNGLFKTAVSTLTTIQPSSTDIIMRHVLTNLYIHCTQHAHSNIQNQTDLKTTIEQKYKSLLLDKMITKAQAKSEKQSADRKQLQ